MSLDITSYSSEVPDGAALLDYTAFDPDAIYALDFDGVIISSDDDDIYHLPSWPGEEDLLSSAARRLGIKCDGMELKYRRHLLYQASACLSDIPLEEGVGMPLARYVASAGRLFVITARSGWYAVERMRRFLERHDVTPIEIFNVGRVKKDRQVELLCREFAPRKVFYVEDSAAHLAAVNSISCENLALVWAPRSSTKRSVGEMQERLREVLEMR